MYLVHTPHIGESVLVHQDSIYLVPTPQNGEEIPEALP